MTQTQAILPIQHVTESYLAEIVAPLLIVSPLGQVIARIAARDIGIEVGGVIGEQTPTHQLFFFPQSQQTQLRLFQRILLYGEILFSFRQNLFEGIPKGLRSKAL